MHRLTATVRSERARALRAASRAMIGVAIVISIAAGVALGTFLGDSTATQAAQPDQVGKGHNVPEVPVSMLLPAASVLGGTGYYLVARWREVRGRRRDSSDDDR